MIPKGSIFELIEFNVVIYKYIRCEYYIIQVHIG